MKDATAIALLIVLIIASAGAGYYIGTSNGRTTTSTTTSTVTSLGSSAIPSLEMIASVSPSVITAGQNVSITLGVYNALSTSLTINVTAYTNQYLGPCFFDEFPITYYIYTGHLVFSNLTFGTALLLYNPSISGMCIAAYNVSLTLQPHSDKATVYNFNFPNSPTGMIFVNGTFNCSGFWMRGPGSGHSFNTFTPGQYTVLVNDTWGQQELEYFTVNP